MKNNRELRRRPGASGPAAHALRGAREISIALSEPMRDSIRAYQADHPDMETVALSLDVQGAEIDPESGLRFGARLVFPRCGILRAPVKAQGGRLARDGELVALDDGVHGGVAVRCLNQVASYL
jgi:hypothetical protein